MVARGRQRWIQKKQLHCLSFGSQKSEIKVKIYNKSREQGLLLPSTIDKNGVVKEPEPEKTLDCKELGRIAYE